MIKCPFCGITHVANTLFCSECGTYLLEDDRRGTDPLGTDEIGWVGEQEDDAAATRPVKGTGPLSVRLKIGDVDPRGQEANCYTISEKARAIGGSVLEAVLRVFN